LVICQKDIVNRYLKILQGAHLKAEKLALSSQGICNWYQDFSARKNIREARPVVILDIDMKNTDICFYYKENLLFTRSVNFGILDMKEGKADILIEELHKTFSALQKEQLATDIAKIVITTAFEGSNFLAEKLKVEFNYLVESANPLNEISLEKELIVPLAVKDGGCSVTSILGLILEKAKNQINLLPIEVKEEQAQANKLRDLAFLGALLVLTLIFFILAMSVKIYKKERYLKRLDAILKEESPKAKKVEASIKKLSLVRDRLNPIGSSIDVIYELYNIIPDGVTLSIFSFDDGELITLQGVARKMSDVFNFQSILEKSPYFKNVEVKYASKRRVRQTEVTDFRISCVVDKEKIIRP
jgi:Tfp pilus assembly protein PilN